MLFTIAALRGVEAACVLVVSDLVGGEEFVRITDDELAAAVERMTRLALRGRGGRPLAATATGVMVVNPASDQRPHRAALARDRPRPPRRAASTSTCAPTEAAGHASELTRAALREGAGLIVAVGGDGTVSEVANGFFDGDAAVNPAAELAVIPRGSRMRLREDLRDPKARRPRRRRGVRRRPCGRSTSAASGSPTGTAGRRPGIFCNVASAGLTGVAADRVNRSGKPLGATVAFAWGTIVTFVGYRNSRFRVQIDERELDQVCNNVIVGELPLLRERDEDHADGRARATGCSTCSCGATSARPTWPATCTGSTAARTSATPRPTSAVRAG